MCMMLSISALIINDRPLLDLQLTWKCRRRPYPMQLIYNAATDAQSNGFLCMLGCLGTLV